MNDNLRIIDYADAHQRAFQALNEAWLKKYFFVEPIDVEVLGDPKTHILDKGGVILLAEISAPPSSTLPPPAGGDKKRIVGTVTLIPDGKGGWELSKMSVDEACQGRGIGKALMHAVIARARAMGLQQIYILTSSLLGVALHIYRSFGFVDVEPKPEDLAHYDRCDTRLELDLSTSAA